MSSFNDIPNMYEMVEGVKGANNVHAILVGNKIDLVNERVVTTQQDIQSL